MNISVHILCNSDVDRYMHVKIRISVTCISTEHIIIAQHLLQTCDAYSPTTLVLTKLITRCLNMVFEELQDK